MNLSKLRSRSMSESQIGKVSFRKVFKVRGVHSRNEIREGLESFSRPIIKQSVDEQKHNNQTLQPVQTKKIIESQDKIKAVLLKFNFKHHSEEDCLCGACNCGRHLCKLKSIRPSFKMRTSYSLHYDSKMQEKSLKDTVIQTKEVSPLKGPTLVTKSNYKNNFGTLEMGKLQMKRPQDSLKFDGPSQTLTLYGYQFRKYGGTNQYIRPTDRHTISHFPLAHKTSYSSDFKVKKIERTQSLKNRDSLRGGKMWLGKSVYSQQYIKKAENPEVTKSQNLVMKKSGTLLKNLDLGCRFVTNYKKQFIEKQQVHCPSKLQMRRSAQKLKLRYLLNQNGDFRGMNPEFKAIATSKHYYV